MQLLIGLGVCIAFFGYLICLVSQAVGINPLIAYGVGIFVGSIYWAYRIKPLDKDDELY